MSDQILSAFSKSLEVENVFDDCPSSSSKTWGEERRHCWITNSNSSSGNNNSRGALVSFQVDGARWWWWFRYRFFRNRFFLSRLSREVDDVEVEVSSRLWDWWGGDGAELKPGDEGPEW